MDPSSHPYATDRLRSLVEDARVHRDVYASREVFDLEMERIFGRAWLLIGHDSQVPERGDFLATRMGSQPVMLVRQKDGSTKVMFNRCTHRGSTICSAERGRVSQFVCPYHGWAYSLDGELQGVPVPEGYGETVRERMAGLGLPAVPRQETYRGFVFASLAEDGPGLMEFLGPLKASFDDLVDRAPDGEVEVAGGVSKHVYEGNWKFVLENHLDAVHPRFVHASSVAAANEQSDEAFTDGTGEVALRQMRQNGAPNEVWEKTGLWVAPNGHGWMGDYHDDKKLMTNSGDPVHAEYIRRMEAAYGAEETRRILGETRWNSIVFPNVSFMSQFGQLRIVHPLAVDRTAVYTYAFRLKGAPEEMFERSVAFANIVNGTGSTVLTDDLEVYERMQIGLHTDGTEWIDYSRGLGRDIVDDLVGLERGGTGTSEIAIRNQYRAWTDYMTAGA